MIRWCKDTIFYRIKVGFSYLLYFFGKNYGIFEPAPVCSFTYRQECDVKRYMNCQPDKEEAAGTVLNASLPFLKSDECERVKGQLSYIVKDMKEERQQSRNRGYHM